MSPSPETEMALLKKGLEDLERKVDEHKDELHQKLDGDKKELKDAIGKTDARIDSRFNELADAVNKLGQRNETTYSRKWVETAVTWALYSVGGVLLTAAVVLLLMKAHQAV